MAGGPDVIADTLRTLNILQQAPEERLAQNIDEARQVAYNLLEA